MQRKLDMRLDNVQRLETPEPMSDRNNTAMVAANTVNQTTLMKGATSDFSEIQQYDQDKIF